MQGTGVRVGRRHFGELQPYNRRGRQAGYRASVAQLAGDVLAPAVGGLAGRDSTAVASTGADLREPMTACDWRRNESRSGRSVTQAPTPVESPAVRRIGDGNPAAMSGVRADLNEGQPDAESGAGRRDESSAQ